MNINHRIIEFLTYPELPFGTEEDLLLLDDPQLLRDRVASLLEEYPGILGEAQSADLKAGLDGAAWSFIAMEFQARIESASRFFEGDAKN